MRSTRNAPVSFSTGASNIELRHSMHKPNSVRVYEKMATHFMSKLTNRNEYQEYFLGVKTTGAYCLQPYHLQLPNVSKSGSHNLLYPSGPVQACNGIALPYADSFPAGQGKRKCR
jgi:hypothetical protein